ncbi:hypothetical protein GCM10011380_08820 [Sphingomonas metalli]|uniref:Head-tail adaptor protein n=2 Tax=Sphingomonas metalli TaxID=1779358 RepID=A0A916SXG9_9SPHN|nr:hypothetical protein GCM10011380_08820 [Sphingomonas metalli]
MIPRGRLKTRLTIERPVADSSFDGAGATSWIAVRKVYAEVLDILPSRGEQQRDGYSSSAWRARVRMDYRADITPDMRFVGRSRVMQIISGPARVEHLNAAEFIVEEFTPAGGS